MLELFWLLLPFSAASGWWLARRSPGWRPPPHSNSAEYFKGLNYLLDDKPDQAIEVFVRMAELDRDTVETHLTLGSLFRRRGEVDRAIHIHHNLTTRTNLTVVQRHRAILELAEDYMRAGLFDRAEALYQELIAQPEHTEHTAIALNRLIKIYEQEKDWQKAIAHCDLLERRTGQVRKTEAAHYCCELAEEALQHDDRQAAQSHLQEGLQRDSNCARASIMQGHLAQAVEQYATAIQTFKVVERQNPAYLPEVIEPLKQCYAMLDQHEALLAYLKEIHGRHHSGRLTAVLAQLMAQQKGPEAALAFVEGELKEYPTFWALRCYIELKLADGANGDNSDINTLYRTSKHMLDGAARYRCDNCGFTVRSLHWHCPSCKRWESVKPLRDLICHSQV